MNAAVRYLVVLLCVCLCISVSASLVCRGSARLLLIPVFKGCLWGKETRAERTAPRLCTATWKQTDPQTDRYSKGAVTEVYTTVWKSEVNRTTASVTRHRAQRTDF